MPHQHRLATRREFATLEGRVRRAKNRVRANPVRAEVSATYIGSFNLHFQSHTVGKLGDSRGVIHLVNTGSSEVLGIGEGTGLHCRNDAGQHKRRANILADTCGGDRGLAISHRHNIQPHIPAIWSRSYLAASGSRSAGLYSNNSNSLTNGVLRQTVVS